MTLDELDPDTPVIVGVGQASERFDDPDYQGLGEADLAARAVRAALEDAGSDQIAGVVDTVAAVRSFEVSTPLSAAPLGRPDNMPRAVAARTGLDPRRAIAEVTGGQSPQALVTELAATIASGASQAAVIFGAEVISTVRHALSRPESQRPDFTEHIGGQLEDRGFGLRGLTSLPEVRHGLRTPLPQYALLENARRHRIGSDPASYAAAMGELFAPMTHVAAANPHAAAPTIRTAAELVEVTESNRVVADPFTRLIVARDQVNQAAATIVMSVRAARAASIDPQRWVFLHGHAALTEQPLLARPDLSVAPAAPAALGHALEVAGLGLDDIAHLDLYSCFPIAVFNICDAFGLRHDDPRGLTVTGGLPFFGGPGNNYSMHAIAEIIGRVRSAPGDFGAVVANGGLLSKHAVGVYSTTPAPWRPGNNAAIQERLDARRSVPRVDDADGPARIESHTVIPGKDGRRTAIVIGRLLDPTTGEEGGRFVANVHAADDEMFQALRGDAIGAEVYVRSSANGNRVSVSRASAEINAPRPIPRIRDSYEHIEVRRDGHLLEVTINRPEARNALHPAANAELDEVFDAYFAEPELWVAILTGKGDKAFSAGNDLAATAGGAAFAVPANGFAGLTARTHMPKPVIAAVNGFALGGGCEIALACHLVVADEEASFGLPEVRVGLAAAAGGLVRLPRAVGPALARDMILTGRRLSASEAAAAGLVSRIAPRGKAVETARSVADEILAGSPVAVRASLETMQSTAAITDDVSAIKASAAVLDSLIAASDTVEGITAFVTKRSPDWTGH